MEFSQSSPGQQALRRGRRSLPGQIFLLTTVTHGRRPWFLDRDLACHAARVIAAPAQWQSAHLLCWVLMPDHWHGVVELGDDECLAELMQRLKALTAIEVNRERRSVGAVWAAGFHDHALRHEEDLIGIARYVVTNPLRAGLVSKLADYPFWDAVWL